METDLTEGAIQPKLHLIQVAVPILAEAALVAVQVPKVHHLVQPGLNINML